MEQWSKDPNKRYYDNLVPRKKHFTLFIKSNSTYITDLNGIGLFFSFEELLENNPGEHLHDLRVEKHTLNTTQGILTIKENNDKFYIKIKILCYEKKH